MIEEASVAIETQVELEKRLQAEKYARRNKMRYIDRLLNELERLNLSDRPFPPPGITSAVKELAADASVSGCARCEESVLAAMDCLYEIQDALMGHPDEEDD